MKEILTELFGKGIGEEGFEKFKEEMGKRYVEKSEYDQLLAEKEELKEKTADLSEKAAYADEYERQLEELKERVRIEKEKETAERAEKEKEEEIKSRFSAVSENKKFRHNAIREDYLRKFGEALKDGQFEGKTDAEIFDELTKDDRKAFENVTVFKLAGGMGKNFGEDTSVAEARAVMGLAPLK